MDLKRMKEVGFAFLFRSIIFAPISFLIVAYFLFVSGFVTLSTGPIIGMIIFSSTLSVTSILNRTKKANPNSDYMNQDFIGKPNFLERIEIKTYYFLASFKNIFKSKNNKQIKNKKIPKIINNIKNTEKENMNIKSSIKKETAEQSKKGKGLK